MAAKPTGKREIYEKIVKRIYSEGKSVATVAHIAEETGDALNAIGDIVHAMAARKQITVLSSGLRGQIRFLLPNNVLIPPEATIITRRPIGAMADYDDLYIIQRLCDFIQEFMRRGLTMDHVAGYMMRYHERPK